MSEFLNATLLNVFLPYPCRIYGVLCLPIVCVHNIVHQEERLVMRQTETVFQVRSHRGLVVSSVNKNDVKGGMGIGFNKLGEHDRGIAEDQYMTSRILLIDPCLGDGDIGMASQIKRGHMNIWML